LFALVSSKKGNQVEFTKHKVKRGDSLWKIATKYNSTITSICELNKIPRTKPIRIGKTLTIAKDIYGKKKSSYNKPKKIYHTVKSGDSISELAVKYKVSIKNIKKWNNLKGSNIRIGWKLIIWK
jgi:LysM repeat protein